MSNIKTTLAYSPLSGSVYWGRVNLDTGVSVGNSKKDVTSAFLQCLEHKFPVNTKQNIEVNGEHHSTIYNIAAGRKMYAFDAINPDAIDNTKYQTLIEMFGLLYFDSHGCCKNCSNDLSKELGCDCSKHEKKLDMIMELCKA